MRSGLSSTISFLVLGRTYVIYAFDLFYFITGPGKQNLVRVIKKYADGGGKLHCSHENDYSRFFRERGFGTDGSVC